MNRNIQLCLEILANYYPEKSGREAEAAILFDLIPSEQTHASWKEEACNWLAKNLVVKTESCN